VVARRGEAFALACVGGRRDLWCVVRADGKHEVQETNVAFLNQGDRKQSVTLKALLQ
jgi:hypothetical protein